MVQSCGTSGEMKNSYKFLVERLETYVGVGLRTILKWILKY
jgi:hypothetical protein